MRTKKFNVLRFALFDAAEDHEAWTRSYGYTSSPAVKIFVDDRELNSLFVEIEDREMNLHQETQMKSMCISLLMCYGMS